MEDKDVTTVDEQTGGGSRRDFLKKSAIAGGTVAFAAPMVQTIGMKLAGAQTISPGGPGPCDTQISFNYDVGSDEAHISFGNNGDFNGQGECDLTGCADVGSASDIAGLKHAVTNAEWISDVVVNGKKCARLDLAALEAFINTHHIENCSISAVFVKAGSQIVPGRPGGSTTLECEPQTPPAGPVITICRTHIEANLQTKDVSNVSVCLCCTVTDSDA